MFKKKPIYIVGIILFTLILIADLALLFLVPTGGGRGNMPGMSSGSFEGQMPEGFDSGEFDPESFGGQMPGGSFDFGDFEGEMPEDFGGFGGQQPNGSGDFTMPEGFDSANVPEDFDASNVPNRGQMGGQSGGGFLRTLRSAFWPILIVCVLGDALCIFMLIRISRKKENDQENDDDNDGDNPPRRDHTNTWLAIIAVLLVGAVALTSLPSGEAGTGMEAEAAVLQAEASIGDIANHFSGSGTLESSDAEELEIPSSVTVTSFTVKNGDVVQVGDVIANVDKTSVQKAIYEVQSLISDMDAEIAEVQSDTLEDKITARADGRVKAIYVAAGDSVASAMYENSAVILISLGGSMTVVIESEEEAAVGQTLTVTLSDESQIEGKVQQVRDGKITITTTDDGPTPDDTVTVAAEDGTVLGTGTLSISSPMKVTGYFGTVDKIKVDVGDKVKAGDTLITLKSTADQARYQQLLRERKALTELVNELNVMYQDGAIKASTSGVVSGIDADATYSQLSASSSGSYGIVLLSNIKLNPTTPTEGTPPTEGSDPTEGTPPTEAPPTTEPTTPPAAEPAPTEEAPLPPADPAPAQGDGTFAGKVTKVTYGALQIKISETDITGSSIAAVESMDEALFTADKQYSPSLTVPVNMYVNGQTVPSSINAIQAGDKVLIQVSGDAVTKIDFILGAGMSSQGTAPGGNMQFPSGGGSFGGSSSAQEEDEEDAVYEVEKTALCAIIPAETMTIAISVDELDVLTLAVGQEAVITLDALPGQSFTGTVKKINPTGTNEGGSTKYTVTMEVPRSAQMLDGMNASVRIEVSRLEAVLTVPAAAVQEDGNRTFVYTALDEETGEPAKAVDVTTGTTDGINIEILSGLVSGDVVYYSYADSVIYR